MTTEEKQAVAHDQVLAASVPDDNTILMRILRMLLRPRETYRWMAPITGIGAIVIILLYVISKWGVMAILALQPFLIQIYQDESKLRMADKDAIRAQVKATEEVLSAVQQVGEDVKSQGLRIDEQGQKLEALTQDVKSLQGAQASTSKQVGAVAAQQQALKRQLERAK